MGWKKKNKKKQSEQYIDVASQENVGINSPTKTIPQKPQPAATAASRIYNNVSQPPPKSISSAAEPHVHHQQARHFLYLELTLEQAQTILDKSIGHILGPVSAIQQRQILCQQLYKAGGLKPFLNNTRGTSAAPNNPRMAADAYKVFYAVDQIYLENYRLVHSLTVEQYKILSSGYFASPAVVFAGLDLQCPVAWALVLQCGAAPLDVVYGALRWQQLVMNNPSWLAAVQRKGILVFQTHAFTPMHHQGWNYTAAPVINYGNFVCTATHSINFSSIEAPLVALFIGCVWHSRRLNEAWYAGSSGRVGAFEHAIYERQYRWVEGVSQVQSWLSKVLGLNIGEEMAAAALRLSLC